MVDDARKTGVLRWRGMLAEGTVRLRRAVTVVLAIACVMLVVTQWGYVGVLFAGGAVTYLMFTLAPVALAALLLGVLPGVAMGFFSGAILCLHAHFVPLDYYELAFVTPVSSIVATTVCGFVLGMLFSAVFRGRSSGSTRAILLMLACLVASCAFGVCFGAALRWHVPALAEANQLHVTPQGMALQTVGDAMFMTIVTLVSLVVVERAGVRVNLAELRAVFGVCLLGVVVTAFMVVAMIAYVSVTGTKLQESLDSMGSEANYLLKQVIRAADYDWKMTQLFFSRDNTTLESQAELDELDPGGMVLSLINGYAEDEDGLIIVLTQERILGLDTDRLLAKPGDAIDDCLESSLLAAARRSADNGTLEQVVYVAPGKYNDLVDLVLPESPGRNPSLVTPQVGYLVAVRSEEFMVIIIHPASMVFEGRADVVGWITAVSLGLLIMVAALVWRLLDRMVAKRIDATNKALCLITEGDLDVRVEPDGTFEFQELSVGINQTVDALQGWIAEAERRMDAEMAAARAIQESALPSVRSPFPDIQCFDIYASMNAAKDVGGDFFDFFLVGDDCGPTSGRLAFVIADVSGKGVPAALFMMKAKTQIHDYLESGMELGEAVKNANQRLCEGNEEEGMFVTAWVGVLDYASGHVDYVNAGHNPPLILQGGTWRLAKELSGMPLGILEEVSYTTRSVDLRQEDKILLYTDGVTEAFSTGEEQYGEKRLVRVAGECSDLRPHDLVDRVRKSVAAFSAGAEQSDDITLLALQIDALPEGGGA